jgi:hypothetical protein
MSTTVPEAATDAPRLLVRPWCPCGVSARLVHETTPCARCGRRAWQEKHVAAFVEFDQREDGWYGRQDQIPHLWNGPFASREFAATVRHDHAPAYLVCGLCDYNDIDEDVVVHYAVMHHLSADEPLLGEDLGDVKQSWK